MSSDPLQFPHPPAAEAQRLHAQGEAAALPLYDSNAVWIASFFGTPTAGGWLMFLNERHMGRTGRGVLLLAATAVVTGFAILLGYSIPQSSAGVFAILLVMATGWLARVTEAKELAAHVARGGPLASKWKAFWTGVTFFVLIFGTMFIAFFIPTYKSEYGNKVVIGTKDEVFYTGKATQADAQGLGNVLKADSYFEDRGVTVIVNKGAEGTTISFIVKEGSWNDPTTMPNFEELARQGAAAVGGLPVKVQLLNKDRDVKQQSQVGSVNFTGGDRVFYMGNATAAQAQALGKAFQSEGFFKGKGADVFLAKHSDGTTISFVLGDGAWDDAQVVTDFENFTRQAAPAVGGLPVRLRLESTALDVKKDEVLK